MNLFNGLSADKHNTPFFVQVIFDKISIDINIQYNTGNKLNNSFLILFESMFIF